MLVVAAAAEEWSGGATSAGRVEPSGHGRSPDPALQTADEPERLAQDEPALAACYAAAAQGVSVAGERAGQPTLRLMVSCDPPEQTPGALPDQPVATLLARRASSLSDPTSLSALPLYLRTSNSVRLQRWPRTTPFAGQPGRGPSRSRLAFHWQALPMCCVQ
jgi:hypothetical protein